MKMERIDIYDENENLTGRTFVRGVDELKDGEFFVFVQTWIFNNENKLLLTQRNLNKKCGGLWEPTNGHVFAGEKPIDAMVRELGEEIGVETTSSELKEFKTILNGKTFRKIWTLKKDIKVDDLKYTDDEVIDAKYVDMDELQVMIDNNEIVPKNEYIMEVFKSIM